MFAPLKRIAILAAVLLFPGVAFSYVSVHHVQIDNWVPEGSQGFVVNIIATVSEGDSWESTLFSFDSNYDPVCLDNEDFGPGLIQQVFYVPFDNETADLDDTVDVYTFDDDDCDEPDENTYLAWPNAPMYVDSPGDDCSGEDLCWPEITLFTVNKVFRPSSDLDIQVDINCSAGSPGDDSATMGENGLHQFPQEFLNPSNPNHNCVITEADVPPGYQAFYVTNPQQPSFFGLIDEIYGFLDIDFVSADGCHFYGSGNMRGGNTCQIINVGLPSTFTVFKNWEVFQDGDANFVDTDELVVRMKVSCSNDIKSAHVADEGQCMDDDADSGYNGCSWDSYSGPFQNIFDPHNFTWVTTGDAVMTLEVEVDGYENTVCYADEDVYYSNVERRASSCHTSDDGLYLPIAFELEPGGGDGCGFLNTVFFEGIPTLSQYGMALMALLMLGVGFVGFRRFV